MSHSSRILKETDKNVQPIDIVPGKLHIIRSPESVTLVPDSQRRPELTQCFLLGDTRCQFGQRLAGVCRKSSSGTA